MTLHDFERIERRLATVANPVRFLTNLFAHSPVGFAVWTASGQALLTNDAFIEIFGVEPPPEYNVLEDELLAANGMLPLFQRGFRGETVQVPAFWYDPRDHTSFEVRGGRRASVSMTIFPLFDDAGRVEFVAATYKDETAARNAERAAEETARRLRLLAESSSHFASVKPTSAEVLDVLARRMSEAIGDLCAIRLVSGDGAALEATGAIHHLSASIAPEERAALASLAHHEAAELLDVRSLMVVPLKIHERVRGVITMTRSAPGNPYTEADLRLAEDLANRAALALDRVRLIERLEAQKRALEATTDELRRSEAKKAAVMEAALDAIVVMDHRGTITDFNPAAERTFGHSKSDVVGRLLADVVVPDDMRAAHTESLARYVEGGDARILGRRVDLHALRRDGSIFPAEVAVVQIATDGPPVFTGYIRDVSERKQAEAAEILRREKEAAEAANAELEAFSYSVAHDLRAPLRAIGGFTSAFLEDYGGRLDPDGRSLLGRVVAASQRMSTIIDSLLSLARLSRVEPAADRVDVTALATRVCEQLAGADPSRDVRWTVEPGMAASGDPRLVQTVLENLLSNAWKFTRDRRPAHVDVATEHAGSEIVYVVQDDGAGFSMDFAGKLFRPFHRLHTAAEFEGTGVGLATVARIVRRHGGRIWADAKENGGATFRFTLGSARASSLP